MSEGIREKGRQLEPEGAEQGDHESVGVITLHEERLALLAKQLTGDGRARRSAPVADPVEPIRECLHASQALEHGVVVAAVAEHDPGPAHGRVSEDRPQTLRIFVDVAARMQLHEPTVLAVEEQHRGVADQAGVKARQSGHVVDCRVDAVEAGRAQGEVVKVSGQDPPNVTALDERTEQDVGPVEPRPVDMTGDEIVARADVEGAHHMGVGLLGGTRVGGRIVSLHSVDEPLGERDAGRKRGTGSDQDRGRVAPFPGLPQRASDVLDVTERVPLVGHLDCRTIPGLEGQGRGLVEGSARGLWRGAC